MGVRLFAATFTVLLHALVALALLNPHWFERPAGTSLSSPAEPPSTRAASQRGIAVDALTRPSPTVTPVSTHPVATASLDRSARNPGDAESQAAYAAGWQSEANRQAVIHALNAQRYSPEVATILRRPLGEAWPQLEALAQSGNRSAGDALHDLAFECRPGPSAASRTYGYLSASLQAGIPDPDRAFVAGALAHELAAIEATQNQCTTHDLGFARLAAMLGLPHPSTDPHNDELAYRVALGETFRATFGGGGGAIAAESTPGAIALFQLTDGDSTAPASDLAVAIEAAEDEPLVAARLAYCFEHGCGQVPVLPPQEQRPWQEQAAHLGSGSAATAIVEADESAGELERAYAWAWFARWVASHACDFMPRVSDYAMAAQQLARIGARLHPAARQRAEHAGVMMISRHGAGALAATGCTGS